MRWGHLNLTTCIGAGRGAGRALGGRWGGAGRLVGGRVVLEVPVVIRLQRL